MNAPPLVRRVRIDRIDVELRGAQPAGAEAAARAMAPALARALASHGVDAAAPAARRLADHIARQVETSRKGGQ